MLQSCSIAQTAPKFLICIFIVYNSREVLYRKCMFLAGLGPFGSVMDNFTFIESKSLCWIYFWPESNFFTAAIRSFFRQKLSNIQLSLVFFFQIILVYIADTQVIHATNLTKYVRTSTLIYPDLFCKPILDHLDTLFHSQKTSIFFCKKCE